MMVSPHQVAFTLADVKQAACAILAREPDAIPAYRLLRQVLRQPADDPQLIRAKAAALTSKWVRQLEETQLPDGSWGRFHSQDTRVKSDFRTTEEAINRAFALGLEPGEGALLRARQYILDVLEGRVHLTDRDEVNEAWSLLKRFFLAGRLAQIDPAHPQLDSFWQYLVTVAEQTFTTGAYRLEDEAAAYRQLSGVRLPGGFLESQHALWILSGRQLPVHMEHILVDWVWHKPDGIRYLRAPLANPEPRLAGYWLRSMSLLSRFGAWREVCAASMDRLWGARDKEGLWDFGSHIARISDFPLSESWRKAYARKFDTSTCLLALLRKLFD